MLVEEYVVCGDIVTSAAVPSSVQENALPADASVANADPIGAQLISTIVAQLSQSQIYRRAINSFHQLTAANSWDGKVLLEAVSLEAIRLTLEAVQVSRTCVTPAAEPNPIGDAIPELSIDPAADAQLFAAIETVVGHPAKSSFPNLLAYPFKRYKAQRQVAVETVKAATRSEILAQIGRQIQLTREQKGCSIAQLHAQTFIPMYHLQALENGDIDQLPEDIYLRSFFSRIEAAFGLASGHLNDQLFHSQTTPVAVLPSWGGHRAKKRRHRGFGGLDINPTHLYITYAAILASGIYWVSNQTAPPVDLPDLGVAQPPVEAASIPTQTDQPASKPPTAPTQPQPSAKSKSPSAKSVNMHSSESIATPAIMR